MITNPLLLLCDEPTSGIDSFMAQSVMNVMKEMTRRGKAVIFTIHQPSSEVFAMFDRVLILAEGRVAFLGNVDQAHKFFNRCLICAGISSSLINTHREINKHYLQYRGPKPNKQ